MKMLFFLFSIMVSEFLLYADPVTVSSNVIETVGSVTYAKGLKAVQDYEKNPNGWEITNLFDVADGYTDQKKFNTAISIYQKILSVQPTNVIAMRGLGTCYFLTANYDAAIVQYKQGWDSGDDVSLLDLANMYIIASRISEIKSLVPDLLTVRKRMADSGEKHEITNVLIIYSLKGASPPDKNVFLKALDGLSDNFILASKDTTALVVPGLKVFGYQDRADKLAAEIKKAN
jgi:tetratricopeptide (TPR) repeat protein